MASALLSDLALALLPLADGGSSDPTPAAEDVTAGWTALLVFVGLILAVVVLGRSLVTQLRKAQAARDAGVYGDPPAGPESPESPERGEAADESNGHPAQS
jgi:hypothetical protein